MRGEPTVVEAVFLGTPQAHMSTRLRTNYSYLSRRISQTESLTENHTMFAGPRRNGIGLRPRASSGRMEPSMTDCWKIVRTTELPCKLCSSHRVSFWLLTFHRWSYNQGVVLGGLVELNRAAPNNTYLPSADKIAKAAIETLADSNNVIHEFCEPQCLPDGTQFKGIFIRNLAMLQKASPNEIYRNVISSCANSIWDNDRNEKSQFGVNWAGPIEAVVDASTHSSALDALVAAVAAIGA